ncbi:epoxide hydrolase N-terminal domain-containing protein [Asanoa hainanensis]|uniref:epoxide hydrolase N-terminal domain-containing protein n=1 Tax=Asanoa hainanensis TaxID=560556 RepID=UPI00318356C9
MRHSQAALDDLRRRLRATRWPEPAPPDEDAWAQGAPLDYTNLMAVAAANRPSSTCRSRWS